MKSRFRVRLLGISLSKMIPWKSRWVETRLLSIYGPKKVSKIKKGDIGWLRLSDLVLLEKLLKKKLIEIARS